MALALLIGCNLATEMVQTSQLHSQHVNGKKVWQLLNNLAQTKTAIRKIERQ